MSNFFKVIHSSTKSKARLGEIHTAHGTIQTPAFVPVATKGTLKSIVPTLIETLNLQVAFVNTYHIVVHPGASVVEESGGIQKFSNIRLPFMSDSGGFQVFSLDKQKRTASFFSEPVIETEGTLAMPTEQKEALILKISDEGVSFRSIYNGSVIEFSPESSIEYQTQIGADMLMAFDECTYYPATHEYAALAMKRTHDWLLRCIKAIKDIRNDADTGKRKIVNRDQYLYGIIQGGTYEDLRKKSAEFIVNQDVEGIAIGGVAVGESKAEIREQVNWVTPYLPINKPVHLLGIGHIDDIYDLITHGIDSFDCVEPTRLGRMGVIYNIQHKTLNVKEYATKIDIKQIVYKNNLEKVDENCDCYVCTNFTKAYLHHLFKQKELLGYTLASYHNLAVMERFMKIIREKIGRDEI